MGERVCFCCVCVCDIRRSDSDEFFNVFSLSLVLYPEEQLGMSTGCRAGGLTYCEARDGESGTHAPLQARARLCAHTQ